jgi:hypothetical protein
MKKNASRVVGLASTALIGLGLALAVPGIAQAETVAGLSGTVAANLDTTVNINCSSFADSSTADDVLKAEGAVITFNVTGTCATGMTIDTYDTNYSETGGITVGGTFTAATASPGTVIAGAVPAAFTVEGNTRVHLVKDGTPFDLYIVVVDVPDVADPVGTLRQSGDITIAATPTLEFTLTDNTGGDGHYLGDDENCALTEGAHAYATGTLTVDRSGTYSIRVVNTNPLTDSTAGWGADIPMSDPFLAVYSSFDPANPDANVVGCNDDGEYNKGDEPGDYPTQGATLSPKYLINGLYPWFSSKLAAGSYTYVLSTYSQYGISNWEGGAQAATIEVWGLDDTLADTGAREIPAWATFGGAGLVIVGLALAAASLVLRRRAS